MTFQRFYANNIKSNEQAGLVENEPVASEDDRNLRTILRIRKRIDKENPASLIEVENDKEVIFRPEGKNRSDKYSFSKGKQFLSEYLGYV